MDFNLGDVLRVVRGSRRSVIGSDESFGLALVSVSVPLDLSPALGSVSSPDPISRMELFKFAFEPISSFFDFSVLSPPPVHVVLELLILDPFVGIWSCNGTRALSGDSVTVVNDFG